jgi:hypothetical protein
MTMRQIRPAAALIAVLALSSCAGIGLDPLDPFGDADETDTAAEAQPDLGTEGSPSLPEAEAGAMDEAADEAVDETAAGTGDAAEGEAADELAAADAQPPGDAAAAADAPHVYMSLQPDRAGATSVVFAIDRSRDGTPSDEPAIRITPEAIEAQSGRCNPQQLRYYKFPPESAGRPVYGPDEAARGVDARTLPEFMATAVSAEMMARGLASDLEQTRPQNVCTRKLFEQTIIAATTGQG